jgi:hypothetical protein
MALKDRRQEILAYIKACTPYLEYNASMLDIFEGGLKKYVLNVLENSLSENYFNQIKDRVLPINILKRYVDKVSGVYNHNPIRSADGQDAELIKYYEDECDMNVVMACADEFIQLFKGYAIEPYLDDGGVSPVPRVRVIPYDRFLVYSDNLVNPLKPTVFIKIMGKQAVKTGRGYDQRMYYFVYTDTEFDAFDAAGQDLPQYLEGNGGVNPYGVIPFYYGFRSKTKLMPTQDTDIKAMTEMVPVMLTDMAGAIMYQCFSVIYGVDVKAENLTLSPNAFWDLKSDPASGKEPKVGTITPQADVDKVIKFIMSALSLWLETKGIKSGSIGSLDGGAAASGIAKMIDEADATALKKANMTSFKADEKGMWQLIKTMNNYWVSTGMLSNVGLFSSAFDMRIEFDDPRPLLDRRSEVETVDLEVRSGYLDKKSAMKRLYPDLSEEQIAARLLLIEEEGEIDDSRDGADAASNEEGSGVDGTDSEPGTEEDAEASVLKEPQGNSD